MEFKTLLLGVSAMALFIPGQAHAVATCPAAYDCFGDTGSDNCQLSGSTVTCDFQTWAAPGTTGVDAKAISDYGSSVAVWGTDGDGEDFCCEISGANLSVIIKGMNSYGDTIDLNDAARGFHLNCGNNKVYGQGGVDTITGSSMMNDYIDGGTENDTIYGTPGDDTIYGSGGNDTIYGGDGDDTISGGDGDDHLFGVGDNDTISGDLGDDIIHGDDGDDVLDGGDGDDDIRGGDGPDDIWGGDGLDDLCGDLGGDSIYGENDNDRLYGGGGIDVIDGGAGASNECGYTPDTMNNCFSTTLAQCMAP